MRLAGRLLLLLFGPLALAHDGQGQADSGGQGPPGPGEGSPSLRITPSNTAFALSFYHLVASQSPGSNVFFSPLSISAAYAMLSLGARSHTRTQLLEGLGFNVSAVPEADIHLGFRHLLQTLNRPDDELELRLGSALFLSRDLQPLPRFLNDTAAFYASRLVRTDFLDPEGAAQLINQHVQEETRGKIRNLVSGLSAGSVLVLVNYLFLKGELRCSRPCPPAGDQLHVRLERQVCRAGSSAAPIAPFCDDRGLGRA